MNKIPLPSDPAEFDALKRRLATFNPELRGFY